MEFDLDALSTATLFDATAQPDGAALRARGAIVGRYVLIRELGRGGMGEVWAAWDPKLERELAIKFLRPRRSEADHLRLLREAQALARLSSPHVVVVHDVGEVEGALFVAMELIQGETLRAWGAGPRRWQDIVAVYIEAARGLVAAHAMGLVHRDFKPDNAMIEAETGRVRVMDFGLVIAVDEGEGRVTHEGRGPEARNTKDTKAAREAKETSEAVDELKRSSGTLSRNLTAASAIVGTPAYMSSEQLAGQRGGPPTDQFSFCVSLWEALFGKRPFAGSNMDELERAILAGELRPRPPGSRVPARIVAALARGLRPDPGSRWPSMEALIAELEAPARRRARLRLTGLALGVGLALAGVVGLAVRGFAVRGSGGSDSCEDQGARLDGRWDGERRAAVELALAQAGPSGVEAATRVEASLDEWSASWSEVAAKACRGNDGVPEALDVAQALCLEAQLEVLELSVDLLAQADLDAEASSERARHAVDLVAELPDPRRCADPSVLVDLDANQREDDPALETFTRDLARAKVLGHAGDWDGVIEVLAPLVDAPALLGSARLEARLLADLGWARYERRESAAASELLARAYERALAAGDDRLAAELAIDLMFAHTRSDPHIAEAKAWDLHARALLDRLEDVEELRVDRLAALGFVAETEGDYAAARDHYQDALTSIGDAATPKARLRRARLLDDLGAMHVSLGELERGRALQRETASELEQLLGPSHPDIASVHYKLGSTAFAAGEPDQARAEFELAVEIGALSLGPDAALVLAARTGLGAAALVAGDPASARAVFEEVLASGERRFGLAHPELVPPLVNLCVAKIELGDFAGAEPDCVRALAILEEAHGPSHPDLLAALDNLGDIRAALDDPEGARAHYRRSLAIGEAAYGPDHPELDYARVGLGQAALELGDADTARAQFDAVVAGRGHEGKHQALLARAELGLAKLELAAGHEVAALDHGRQAHADALAAPTEAADARAQIEAWLAAHDVGP